MLVTLYRGVKLSNRHLITEQQLYQHYNSIKDNILKLEHLILCVIINTLSFL
jgi:hypothetical protein